MQIERNELVELLRCRGNDHTAERAELSLPPLVDLHRDRATLRQCGIDPNVLAFILSRQERTRDVTRPPSQPSVDDDDADGGSGRVDRAPRRFPARQGPSEPGSRTVLGTTNSISRQSLQSLPSSDQHADQITTRSTSAGKKHTGPRVTTRPAIGCPRCQFAFGSPDLMLDHLNAHHLNAGRPTHTSSDSDGVLHANLAVTPPSAAVLADLESTYRRSSKSRDPRRLVIGVILAYLLIVWLVVILV